MIRTWLLLSALLPTLDSEFEEWEEFQTIEETYEEFIGESLIGSKEWAEYLQELDPHIDPEPIDPNWNILFERYIKKKSVVIDYGAKSGGQTLAFAHLVGGDGKVLAFEPKPELFRGLFWNLVRNNVQNARIVCPEAEEQIDLLELENVSLIRIDANGRENLILKGAEKTIQRCKPVLMLNMLGGIAIERSDRFIKQEMDRRVSEIRKMGYNLQRIGDSWYLGLSHTP
ncbi:MAG: hypothetical protein K1000chlam3_00315 [Chlamydiae bacterium]|nr:hypothetical protein [Chlamydiota bacterium]